MQFRFAAALLTVALTAGGAAAAAQAVRAQAPSARAVGSQAAETQAFEPGTGTGGWRDIASRADRFRLREWRSAWVEAIRAIRTGGNGAALANEGALLNPDAGLRDGAAPPPGEYQCRTIKLGAREEGMSTFTAYPFFRCRITALPDGRLRFVKLTGSQRPVGHLYPESPRRLIFLGALQLGDESEAPRYGSDGERNTPGILERIGANRWRLVFPRPSFESIIDIMELVPVR